MAELDPREVAGWVSGSWFEGLTPKRIHNFCFDTRLLQPGDCFVALTHGVRDGHDFVAEAIERGAGAVMLERVQSCLLPQLVVADTLLAMEAIATAVRDAYHGLVTGITGSCGNTTTKEMLRQLLGESRTHATKANWNNRMGVPMTLFGLQDQDYAVVEAGINQPGEMAHLGRMIAADLVIVTHIGPAHLELLKSVERVAAEKAQLMQYARSHAKLILPAEASTYAEFAPFSSRSIVLASDDSAVPGNAAWVIRYQHRPTGIRLFDTDFEIASTSRGVQSNAALAIVAARELGVNLKTVRERMAAWRPGAIRGQILRAGAQRYYIDCYNANPASMLDALAAFGRTIASTEPRGYVLGAMNELGSAAEELHCSVGRSLRLRTGDRAWFVGPDLLTAAYARGAHEVGCQSEQIRCVDSVEKLKSDVADFEAALFLKGSREYQLETLLPSDLQTEAPI